MFATKPAVKTGQSEYHAALIRSFSTTLNHFVDRAVTTQMTLSEEEFHLLIKLQNIFEYKVSTPSVSP